MHKAEPYGTILLKQKDKQTSSTIKNFACKLLRQMPYQSEIIERSLQELVTEKVLTLDGDTLYQKRMVEDAKLSDTKAEAGRKGGSATQTALHGAKAKPKAPAKTKRQANADIDIDTVNDIDIDVEIDDERISLDESRFNEFWVAYPKKAGKKAAFAAWKKAKVTAELHQAILAAIRLQKTSAQWQKDNGQYIPNPATWLNQGRWDDEITADTGKGKNYNNPFYDLAKEYEERGE